MEAHYESFVVRVWVDPSGDVKHGIIVHSETGTKTSFRDVADIAGIVTDALSGSGNNLLTGGTGGKPPNSSN